MITQVDIKQEEDKSKERRSESIAQAADTGDHTLRHTYDTISSSLLLNE